MSIKNFIDYTHQGDGVNSREALYAAIHDRVAEAINGKKIDIAQNLVGQNEEVEDLDELSKSTLSGYLQKASGDVDTKTKKAGGEALGNKKIDSRLSGMGKASERLAKEEVEELDELSKGTLGSYVKAASYNKQSADFGRGMKAQKRISSDGEYDDNNRVGFRSTKRAKGISKAVDRLAKEEVNEAREDSPIKGTVKKHTYEDGAHKVEVRYNPDFQEYSAHPYKNGKHMGEGPVSYHGDDKEDAHHTAKSMLANLCK
jgi:hypothetical protein